MTPFSVEKASEGRPWMFQSRTTVGLDRKPEKLKPGEHGTCSSRTYEREGERRSGEGIGAKNNEREGREEKRKRERW
jgi:hypothetical protein